MQVLLNAPLFGTLLEERTSSSDNKYTLDDPNSDERVEIELPECDYAVKSLVELYKQYTNQPQKPGASSNSNSNLQPISPNKLMNTIRQKTGRFQRLVQEDSHELLRSLIDIIRSDEIRRQKAAISSYYGDNKSTLKHDVFTLIDMVFGGYFLSSVKCQKCKYKSQHLEPFFDISLAITDPISDIRAAIANFTSNAILDGDNKFICERCSKINGKKAYEAGVKSTNIAVPPNILTLHLKRFEVSGEMRGGLGGGRKSSGKGKGVSGGGRRARGKNGNKSGDEEDDLLSPGSGGVNFRKINKHIEFSEFLDLSDFTSDLCYDLTKINKWPKINRGDSIWYSLFGVVCHSGNLRGGHYTAYVKTEDPIDENYCMDDFAQFIQNTPYLPELADIDKIRERIKQHDSTRCETTDRFREDDDTHFLNGNGASTSDYYEKPKSIPGNWYHISDSQVRKSNLSHVLTSQAYILFYRRVIE